VEDLSCQELVELVTDYLEGALAPDERARFDAHLAECPGCDRYLAQMRTTIQLAGASSELESRPEVSGLLEAFRDWKRTRYPRQVAAELLDRGD
jgi:anti-sigma factor RsiW